MMRKTILITGAGLRIGKAIAEGLAAQGWRIAVHYHRSKDQAEALADALPTPSIAIGADLSNAHECETLIARSQAALGSPLGALINNASTFEPDEADRFSLKSYDLHFDMNLKAPLLLSKAFAAALPTGENGAIINMIDQQVLNPRPDFFTYNLSKSALYAATKTTAQSFAPNIRVNAIGPGPTLANVHQHQGEFEDDIANTLLKTGSPPDTIVDGVLYLLNARAVTGQMIAIDGGEHLQF